MAQFKDVFLGKWNPGVTTVRLIPKMIRASGKHNDLEGVGYDNYPHTFF
ncbi:MAG: hypothetical protein Ct9H300mP28_03690 [Pseudomonadota bacterium]|nr:MAG: hypothetical protein Ct9H300mP28_03690 [Pseudomonadota bacterium]